MLIGIYWSAGAVATGKDRRWCPGAASEMGNRRDAHVEWDQLHKIVCHFDGWVSLNDGWRVGEGEGGLRLGDGDV